MQNVLGFFIASMLRGMNLLQTSVTDNCRETRIELLDSTRTMAGRLMIVSASRAVGRRGQAAVLPHNLFLDFFA